MAYRILSLDGGGVWSVIQVLTLIDLYGGEDVEGRRVLGDFDLVAANSGGSLVLGGLLENLTLGKIRRLFQSAKILGTLFSPTPKIGDEVLHAMTGLGPRYDAAAKFPAIERLMPRFGGKTLAEAAAGLRRKGSKEDLRVLIVGFDYDRNHATFFRSADSGVPELGAGVGRASSATLAEALHASTNAPVNYFDAPAQFPNRPDRYWDGGITGLNNPVLAAVVEAANCGVAPNDIVALSLGTGTVALPAASSEAEEDLIYIRKRPKQNLVADLGKLATSILDDPPDMATFIAHAMTGYNKGLPETTVSRIVRMSPLISPVGSPGHWRLPKGVSAAKFAELLNLGLDAIEPEQFKLIAKYAAAWIKGAASNQPIRMNWDNLECVLGHDRYSAAKAAWRAVAQLPAAELS